MTSVPGSKSKLLVIDDDSVSAKLYQRVLGSDYDLEFAKDFGAADLLIVEMDFGGMKLEDRLRTKSLLRPFIVISHCNELSRMRAIMRAGAQGYLVKPANESAILLAVERAIGLKQPDFTIDTLEVVSSSGVRSQKLTTREMQIFSFLRSQWGDPIDRDEIIKRTWGKVKVGTKSLDVHLFNLRRKLAPLGLKIEFIPTQGFRLYDARGEPSRQKGASSGRTKKR